MAKTTDWSKRVPKGTRIRTFEELVQVETDDCVLFPHPPTKAGYCHVTIDGKYRYVHQLALERRVGARPDGTHACHSPMPGGHQRHCMNYRHLRWDTPTNNHADSRKDGTEACGENLPQSKLTEHAVREIRSLRGVELQKNLAHRFGVDQSMISRIQNPKSNKYSWKHVT